MCFDCSAPFIAYSLLSTFSDIAENERDAVQVIIELLPCYDVLAGELYVTHEAHVVARIFLEEFRAMARRHCYIQEGPLEDIAETRELLSVIILPLVHHLSQSEYNNIRRTIEDADTLLSHPLPALNELLNKWRLQNFEIVSEWHSYAIEGVEDYRFGLELPNGIRLEEVLMPLPYPTKQDNNDSGYSTEDEGPKPRHERRRKQQIRSHATQVNNPRPVPRSEGTRELALKSKTKPKSKRFFLPRFTSSRTSSDTAHDSSDHSDSPRSFDGQFRRYPNFTQRGDEAECLCETGRMCSLHAEGHRIGYEAAVKVPHRKRLVNLVKTAMMKL
ncbi:hypothetical protein RSOLAG1IB_03174 [Rhizoctonia solani AG-1 IB]|uniref:Uncharacterized protein n=1 Tax=Thanatephorus cucumeris (strain AG1-IB / isolate 7/3/14) TaxID=1108050 RepID=A0A0B7FMR5_THACB|nr:hypothetical protein RSOLAG1IB_03174 [Rhizoctonia solani AG-1 IB]